MSESLMQLWKLNKGAIYSRNLGALIKEKTAEFQQDSKLCGV